MTERLNTATAGVLTCDGSYDSEAKTGADYRTFTWAQITAMVKQPAAAAEKRLAPAIIPSTYASFDGREFRRQLLSGAFVYLAVDVDQGSPAMAKLLDALHAIIGEDADLLVYSTGSATRENMKWRALLRLEEPLDGPTWQDAQNALFDLLEAEGIQCDRALARTAQLVYLPSVTPDRRDANGAPHFYEFAIEESIIGRGLVLEDTLISARMEEIRSEREERLERLRAAAKAQAERQAQRRAAGDQGASVIETFNQRHELEALMLECGYLDDGRGNWSSPHQQAGSGAFSTVIFDRRLFSLSDSDVAAGLGNRPADGGAGCYADAFDLYCHFKHDGDFGLALAAYRQELMAEEFEALGPEGYVDEAAAKARREQQKAENREIGQEAPVATMPERLTLHMALARFVFATDGSRVIDLACPQRDFALGDFANTYAAAVTVVVRTDPETGETKQAKLPTVPLWRKSTSRHTVDCKTFRPGAPTFTTDPRGLVAVNTWRSYERGEPSANYAEHAAVFEEHVAFLFGADAVRVLDWIAHIEQLPGILPHVAWLHISRMTGTGRNALASILTRIWRGHVAASFDLSRCLSSGFNGELSSKLLAIVDELREGGRSDEWAHSESLKRLVTEEQRLINPKYGRQSVEFNCCRLLMFSNHEAAIPLDSSDRRIEVCAYEGQPKPEGYYKRLYGAVADPAFIADVALFLKRRDISGFNPGRHAQASAAKRRVIDVSRSEASIYGAAVAEHWPSDVIENSVLARILEPGSSGASTAAVRRVAAENGVRPLGRPVFLGDANCRVSVIRNHERWQNASNQEVAAEARRGKPDDLGMMETLREYVDGLAAGGGVGPQ